MTTKCGCGLAAADFALAHGDKWCGTECPWRNRMQPMRLDTADDQPRHPNLDNCDAGTCQTCILEGTAKRPASAPFRVEEADRDRARKYLACNGADAAEEGVLAHLIADVRASASAFTACHEVRGSRGACSAGDGCDSCDRLRTSNASSESALGKIRRVFNNSITDDRRKLEAIMGILDDTRAGLGTGSASAADERVSLSEAFDSILSGLKLMRAEGVPRSRGFDCAWAVTCAARSNLLERGTSAPKVDPAALVDAARAVYRAWDEGRSYVNKMLTLGRALKAFPEACRHLRRLEADGHAVECADCHATLTKDGWSAPCASSDDQEKTR